MSLYAENLVESLSSMTCRQTTHFSVSFLGRLSVSFLGRRVSVTE